MVIDKGNERFPKSFLFIIYSGPLFGDIVSIMYAMLFIELNQSYFNKL